MNLLPLCHTLLGDEASALEILEKGVELRLPMMVYTQVHPMLKPLRRLPRFQELTKRIFGRPPLLDTEPRKYKKALLNQGEIDRYKTLLDQLMEQEQPFLAPDLSLRRLAERLDLPPNYLSQLLNEGFGQNFAEYVNSYRVRAFQEKVVDQNFKHLTLLGLAYECGFNSKTVFNTFFKKMTGLTPAAYRKQRLRE
ncbi:MAG: helix-turn-helix domain-containing protein [Bacteroidota bacterium]